MSGEYQEKPTTRRGIEAVAWLVLVAILWGTDLLAKYLAAQQSGVEIDTFRLVSEQVTSAVAVLAMVPFLVHWLRLFKPSATAWPRLVISHTIGSVFFAFGHFVLMVALRTVWYALTGHEYVWREPFVSNLIVEYQKDIKIYIGFALVITAYQYYRRTKSAGRRTRADRLVVQSGKGTRVLRFEDIDYLEAARNYVAVHSDGREYIIRDTMTNLAQALSAGAFQRTHRSFIVNIDKVQEIRSGDGGNLIILKSGESVPLSRSYRDEFNRKMTG